MRSKLRIVILIIPLIVFAILFVYKSDDPFNQSYIKLLDEDGPVESLTAIVYFASGIVSILISKSFFVTKQKWFGSFYMIFAIVFIFIGMEEINWGQQILGTQTPEFLASNVKNEISIHNLQLLDRGFDIALVDVGILGATLWLLFPPIQKYLIKENKQKVESFRNFFVPNVFFITYFIPIIIFYFIFPTFYQTRFDFVHYDEKEIGELFISIGLFLFVLKNYFVQRTEIKKKKKHTT